MPHDIFISYASADKTVADATCAALEAQKIRCWIAPRDVLPGAEYGEELVNAIISCRVLVLIFSTQANESPQVRREIERAVSKGKIILPFRIEDVVPSRAMDYFLSNTHWLDALTPPVEAHLSRLSEVVKALLKLDPIHEKEDDEKVKPVKLNEKPKPKVAAAEDKFNLAKRLIEKNKQTKDTFLDLGKCGLTELPDELAECVWLEELNLADGWYDRSKGFTVWSSNNKRYVITQKLENIDVLCNLINLKELHASHTLISNLSALSGLRNLLRIDLSATKVEDISPLSNLNNLTELYIGWTGIKDVKALSGLKALKELGFTATKIFDFSPISHLVELTKLHLSASKIEDISQLSNLINLTSLGLAQTNIKNFEPLSNFVNLSILDLSRTQIYSLSPISRLTNLSKLNLSETLTEDLSPISNLALLSELNLSDTFIEDFSPLSGLINISRLFLQNSKIEDLLPLSSLNKLSLLSLSETAIEDISSLANLANLSTLYLDQTQVTDISPIKTQLKNNPNFVLVVDCKYMEIPPGEIVDKGNEAIIEYFDANYHKRVKGLKKPNDITQQSKAGYLRNHIDILGLTKLQRGKNLTEVWVYAPHPLEDIAGDNNAILAKQVYANIVSGINYTYFVESKEATIRIIKLTQNLIRTFGSKLTKNEKSLFYQNTSIVILYPSAFLTHYTLHLFKGGIVEVLQSVVFDNRNDLMERLENSQGRKVFELINEQINAHKSISLAEIIKNNRE